MSTKIKNAILVESLENSIKLPVGNYENDDQPYGVSVGQLKNFIDADKSAVAVSGSYDDLLDKPDLNDYVLLATLNSNFYNKVEVENLISESEGVEFKVVDELPEEGERNIIYLVKNEEIYDEYVWQSETSTFKKIGSTDIDFSNYYTKSQVDALIPTVNNSTITFTQGGITKGTITLNQSNSQTIALDSGGSFVQEQSDWNEVDSSSPKFIKNKPQIPSVGDATIKFVMGGVELGHFKTNQSVDDSIEIPETTQVQVDWNETATSSPKYIVNKPTIPTVNNSTITFTQGGITKGTITLNQSNSQTIALDAGGSFEQIQSDWSQTDTTAKDYIKNKPTIPSAQVNSDWNAVSGIAQILNKPTLATVATSGSYNDLSNKPTIPAAQIQSNWSQTDTTAKDYIKNKPTLATVASTGSYNDLSNKPTIPSAQVNSDWNAVSGIAQILNKPILGSMASEDASDYTPSSNLSTVALTGSYTDLSNKPSIPAAQVNSDWNASSGKAQILNKPTLATVATSGSYNDLSNKPTIPSNTRALVVTYEDQTTETITVYTT